MELYLAAMQVVPMLFIALFLNHNRPQETGTQSTLARLRFFHLAVAVLGLLAFSISVFVVGARLDPPTWMGTVVITALACAMAALSTQVFLTLTPKKTTDQQA